jgi:tetratricopeptide (TPR) repeat protein
MNRFSQFISKGGFIPAFIFAIAFLVHANTLGHDYVLDDSIVIKDNQFTQEGISGLGPIFTKDTFYGFFKKDGKDKLVQGGRYRPLSLAMFAIEYELFGLNPFVGHFINVLLFALLCVWIFYFLRLLLKDQRHSEIIAFLSAMLFAVHPIHTEVIANIKGRDELLALWLSILSFYHVLKYTDGNKKSNLLWSVVCIFLASLAKENALTFIAIIPLGLMLFRSFNLSKAIQKSLAAFIGVALFLIIRFSVLGFAMGSESLELMNNPFLRWTGSTYEPLSFFERLPTIFYTLGAYIKLLFVPFGLTHDYYPRYIDLMEWSNIWVLLSLLSYILLGFVFLSQFRKHPIIAFSIGFYLLSLSIVSNVFISIGTNMAERFVFMPSLGFCLLIVYLFLSVLDKVKPVEKINFKDKNLSVLYLIFIVFAIASFSRNKVWENNYTLFTTDVVKSSNSAKLSNAAAGIIIDTHKDDVEAKKVTELTKAKMYTENAIRVHPTYRNAYLLRGNASFYLKEFDDAIAWYERILEMDPTYADAQNNLFEAYVQGGEYAGQTENNITKALRYLHKAEAMRGNQSYEVNRLLGIAYGISKNSEKAVTYFSKCVDLEPNNPWSYYNLITAYANLKDMERVRELEQKIISIDPNFFTNLRNQNG